MLKCLLPALLCLLFLPAGVRAQYPQQQRGLLVYNIGCGALMAGVGAVINKPKGENWKKALARGAWQGSLGGSLHFMGKRVLYNIARHENLLYAWPAKIIHDAGTSIVENAAFGKPFLQNWHTDIGCVRLDFSFRDSKDTRLRFLPESIFAVAAGLYKGHFDASTSLQTGNLCFVKTSIFSRFNGGIEADGVSYGRAIAYASKWATYDMIAHELTHQFQYDEYQSLNAWLFPLRPRSGKAVQKFIIKWIYPDIHYLGMAYILQGFHGLDHYFRNFYEFEAESFATHQFVSRH